MEAPVPEPEWKERLCRNILDGKFKHLPQVIIPSPKIKADDINGDFIRPTAELNEWLKVDSILSDYNHFPESLPRHAMRWIVRLSGNPTTIFDEFERVVSHWVWLGILDAIREQHKHISFGRCAKFIERASRFSQSNIRKEAYNVGAIVIGPEFVRNGLPIALKKYGSGANVT